ncbi:hypothetical protein GGX14DRAFT_328543, partial [Mycena pura]
TDSATTGETDWDGWPDGQFTALFSMEFVERHDNLRVHWATQTLGGRGGSTTADTWQGGKLTRRKCLGIIECDADDCLITIRPQSRPSGIEKQLSQSCVCGGKLHHQPCGLLSTLHTYKNGVFYQNGGNHQHSRPTVRLHLGADEREQFSKIVEQHPKTGPLQLVVGHPTATGPAPSVANISPVLLNTDRVKYERRRVLKGGDGLGGDNFLKEFAKFEGANPDFIRKSQFGQVSVIIMQTSFMASRLIKSVSMDDDAVGGLVSDAAHGFWRERNSLLVVSSTYEPVHLKCWVPVLITYSNGGSAEHYRIHFFELFASFAEQCDQRKIELIDDMFANVVDFSEAERKGFILAFVDFWMERAPDERSVQELLDTAPKLLKGCAQHFRNQITRVKKISGVVDPSQTDIFENYAKRLLKCNNIEEFTADANEFIRAFPKAETWIRWWMLPAHACMLFPSFRIMKLALWKSIPDTTNAEEAMHWKLYAALGKHFALLDGLKALVAFAEYYRSQFEGKKLHYGAKREHWKATARIHGRTKFSRTPGTRQNSFKNDGRPPDTGKALLAGRKRKSLAPYYEKGYKWKDNSCWLDSSLIAIFSAASRDYSQSMEPIYSLPGYEEGGCTVLSNQRDGFRKILLDLPKSTLKSLRDFQTLFVSYYYFIRRFHSAVERAISYFRVCRVRLRGCSGLGIDHFQLERVKWLEQIQLHSDLCRQYNGDLRKWFLDFNRPAKPHPAENCWRGYEGEVFCDGNSFSYDIILNLPITLMLEFSGLDSGDIESGPHWNIPKSLSPYANNPTATARGVKYSIASHVYYNRQTIHFIARYSSDKTHVYDYDGRKHDGHATLNIANLKALTGPTDLITGIPPGYFLHAVVYHLDGGEAAQNYFRREQQRLAGRLGLHFDS